MKFKDPAATINDGLTKAIMPMPADTLSEIMTRIGFPPDVSGSAAGTGAADAGTKPYPFYAFLLGTEDHKEIATFVEARWASLHALTGEDCLLLSVYAPQQPDPAVTAYWEKRTGISMANIAPAPPPIDWCYAVARELHLGMDELPVLYLTDALAGGHGVTLKLPPWNEVDLMRLFESIFQAVHEAVDSGESRMQTVRSNLEGYGVQKIVVYVRQHWKEYINVETLKKAVEILISGILASWKKVWPAS